jgi:cobalamin biosynthesis protein CobW
VVSGFLGSGKTTLVRHLLKQAVANGIRIAVVSNEFGELGIDQALLGEGGDAFVELEGGCVCCRLSDELLETLQMLYERVQPDRIIVETSGVALPFETQMNFWRDPVRAWIDDDMALVVVDASRIHEGLELEGTFTDQVGSADLLVLNKVDLVPVEALPAIEAWLAAEAPDTPIVRCTHGQVPEDLLFPPDPDGLRARRRASPPQVAPHSHEQFSTEEIQVEAGVDPDELEQRLRDLGVLRAKGFVRTSAGPRLVQGVGRRLDLTPTTLQVPDALWGRVVLIRRAPGRHHH